MRDRGLARNRDPGFRGRAWDALLQGQRRELGRSQRKRRRDGFPRGAASGDV